MHGFGSADAGSHEFSSSEYPSHFTRYLVLRPVPRQSMSELTMKSSSELGVGEKGRRAFFSRGVPSPRRVDSPGDDRSDEGAAGVGRLLPEVCRGDFPVHISWQRSEQPPVQARSGCVATLGPLHT